MVKSSLGRRSSNLRPIRLSEAEPRDNDTTRKGEPKRSFIPKPGFTNRSRSSSVDRDSRPSIRSGSKTSIDHKMNRSKSQINMRTPLVSMTPIYSHSNHLPPGSSVRPYGKLDNSRLSSMGLKTSRRDTRPLADKAFQQESQRQVTQFFLRHPQGSTLLEKGTSLKPMTTAMFINLVNTLLQVFDEIVIITSQDYITRLPILMKRYSYRGKVDKSWLQTVNTQHSWPHVLGLLQWLVEVNEAYENFDPLSAFYQTSLDENPTEESDSINFQLFLPFLMKAYETFQSKKNFEMEIVRLEEQLLENIKLHEGINVDDFHALEEEIKELDAELHSPENVAELEELEELKSQKQVMENDIRSCKEHKVKNSKYLAELNEQIEDVRTAKELHEKEIKDLQEDIGVTKAEVDQQVVSVAKKDEMVHEMADLRREIAYQNGCFEEYSKIVYDEDIKIVAARQKLNAALLEYNKLVAIHTIDIPQLKGARIDVNVLHEGAMEELKIVDEILKELRTELKNIRNQLSMELNSLRDLAVNVQEVQNKENDEIVSLGKALAAKEKECNSFKRNMRETTEDMNSNIEELQKKLNNLMERMPDLKELELRLEKKLTDLKNAREDVELMENKILEYSTELKALHQEFTSKMETKVSSAENKLRECVNRFQEPINNVAEMSLRNFPDD